MNRESAGEKIFRVLGSLDYPVGRIFYKGESDTYFTFQMFSAQPCDYGNDSFSSLLYTFQVVLTTKNDYTELLKEFISLLKTEEITIVSIEGETIDIETGFIYVPIIIKVLEE